MATPNIVMTRIDERLVHGQGQLWVKSLGVNTVIVANDQASQDAMAQTLMKTVIPKDVAMRFYSVQKVIDIIHKANPAQTIFLIVKDCKDALRLVEGGVPIKQINIGNIHNCEGKEKVTRSIFLGAEDKAALKEMIEKYNVEFNTQTTPSGSDGSVLVDIKNYLQEIKEYANYIVTGVIIGLWTAFCYSGMLWGIFTNRALVLSFGVGIVCGDLKTALQCGAIAELAFMGFGVGAGGTVPPNPIGPGIIGTLMAITMDGVTPESALSLSIPFAVAIQFLQTAIYTVRAGAPESANNALKKQDFGKFRLHSNLTILLFALVGFLLGFLGAYSMDTLSKLVALVPAWLLKGLTVAGGMLPAIGFAMIMSVMLKKEVVPFALLGYFLAAYLGVPVIGIAIVGTVFALKHYNDAGNVAVAQAATEEVEHDDWI